MDDIAQAFHFALKLILEGDRELFETVKLSIIVSLSASIIAFLIGAPAGAVLATQTFRARPAMLVSLNALLGLPSVVIGLFVYLLLSRSGPLGFLGFLFTPQAMILAQIILTLPIIAVMSYRATETYWADYRDTFVIFGASRLRAVATLISAARGALVTVFLAAFGRAIAEVGAIMMVGGNIRGFTRTMTTTIALQTSRGELALALGLGLVLMGLTLAISAAAFFLNRRMSDY
ncbi:ABC transporter permease [Methylocapsa palsarum]|uniref:Tungstate transport system permease protein n=1 Tax=Methylocapsa palsarum TaxID=1612308 RepID=A0A1I4AJ39_9HYPH|nr:ABC transporter permease [Methylocapsa palsarum]SFK56502.1 tungstate transport system permease protein [Methylocapsa palsarum]